MTEFWKSNKKIYCELCKSWYADNRAQREHHETGMKHKNAILAKIRQVGIQSRQRDDADKHMRATLIAMEVAAHGAYRNDQRQQQVSAPYNVHRPTTGYSVPQSVTTSIVKSTDKQIQSSYMEAPKHSTPFKQVAMEMSRRKAENTKITTYETKSQFWSDIPEPLPLTVGDIDPGLSSTVGNIDPGLSSTVSNIDPGFASTETDARQWVQAISPDGDIYYWHLQTGDTEWDVPPSDGYYTAEEYAALSTTTNDNYYATTDRLIPDESGLGVTVPPPPLNVAVRTSTKSASYKNDSTGKQEVDTTRYHDVYYGSEYSTTSAGNYGGEYSATSAENYGGDYSATSVGNYGSDYSGTSVGNIDQLQPTVMSDDVNQYTNYPPIDPTQYSVDMQQSSTVVDDQNHQQKSSNTLDNSIPDTSANRLEEMLKKQRYGITSDDEKLLKPQTASITNTSTSRSGGNKPFGDWTVVESAPPKKSTTDGAETTNQKLNVKSSDNTVPIASSSTVIQPEERIQFKEKTLGNAGVKHKISDGGPIVFKKRKGPNASRTIKSEIE